MSANLKANIISISLSIAATFIITSLIILIIGKNPVEVYSVMFEEVFASGYGIGQTLFRATPLIICGCALAICFHASIFNIGAEGQLNAGTFTLAVLLFQLRDLPWIAAIPIALIGACIVSGLCGMIPAIIKVKKNVSEVITTIMLNFVVTGAINYLLISYFAVNSTMHTEEIPPDFTIARISDFIGFFEGSSLNLTFIIALVIAFLSWFFIYKTKWGYKIRAVGYNETASKFLGIKIHKVIIYTFTLGAAITAFAGVNYVMGYKGYYEFGFSSNVGFTAIAVALLAKNNPIGVIFSALLFGFLDYGGLAVNQIVPKEIVLVVQGLIVLSIIGIDKIVKAKIK